MTLFNGKPLIGLTIRIFFCLSNSNRGNSDSMSSQSLKILTIFNFAQILHTNSYTGEEQLCQFLEKSVKHVLSYTQVSKKLYLTLDIAHHSLNNISGNK